MGQYWRIISLTAARRVSSLNKLGEGLWRNHKDLVSHLYKHDLPRGPIELILARKIALDANEKELSRQQ